MAKEKRKNKSVSHATLESLIGEAGKKRLMDDIIERKKPVLETERVLNADTPAMIRDIIRHVQDCKTIFVTPDHPDLAPILPEGIDFPYAVPVEITPPRERYYLLDLEMYMRKINCDVRQEFKQGVYKQTTKVGAGGTRLDPTMDRMEQASKLLSFGFNIYAIADQEVQKDLIENLTSIPKPPLRMISQRVRIPYHPEGNKDLLIEMALEPLHIGQTYTGFVWQAPKIDLEIKVGPDPKEKALRHAILAREEERLMSIFPLTRQLKSSPSLGFEEIENSLHKPHLRDRFVTMGVDEKWGQQAVNQIRMLAA